MCCFIRRLNAICLGCLLLLLTSVAARADIFRRDNGQVIPGTEGITPGPGVQLDRRQLLYAQLGSMDLTGSSFELSNLSHASLSLATLTGANLTGAVVTGTSFSGTTYSGLTSAQFYSTNSYQIKDLSGVQFGSDNMDDSPGGANNLSGWNFADQNLTGAYFEAVTLTSANFAGANLTSANLRRSWLSSANLTNAVVKGANLGWNITKEQVYSTASYQQKDLQGIGLAESNLAGGDFSSQDFSNANLSESNLTNANLSGANLTNANLDRSTLTNASLTGAVVKGALLLRTGLTKEQLYATASYQQKNLQGIRFEQQNLASWDFGGQDLSNALLEQSTLTNVNLAGANLTNASLYDSTLTNANLSGAVVKGALLLRTGLTKAQLYATASYQQKSLQRVTLGGNLSNWDFRGQNLTNADFFAADLAGADLSSADARAAYFSPPLDSTGAITRNMIRPDASIRGLNLAAGETLVAYAGVAIPVKVSGGFSIAPTAKLNLTDNAAIVEYTGTSPVATVRQQILIGRGGTGLGGAWTGTGITSSTAAAAVAAAPDSRSLGYAENAAMPLGPYTNFHGAQVDNTSVLFAYTRTGDANLDGLVNDDDVTIVVATYAPGIPKPEWALGDFDYNGFVDDDDVTLLGAFYDPSAAPLGIVTPVGATDIAGVPEPTSALLLATALLGLGIVPLIRRAKLRHGRSIN